MFYEDLVATSGGALAMLAVLVTAFTSFKLLDGVSSILIAFMMIGVAFRVGYDNMVGLIGVAAPPEIEERVARIIFDEPQVTDIYQMRILQEGRYYHVEGLIELKKGMTLAMRMMSNSRSETNCWQTRTSRMLRSEFWRIMASATGSRRRMVKGVLRKQHSLF